jgi:hypothetical protein
MTKNDERLIEASIHYSIAQCGGLARVSTPYPMNSRTKMGVGFDNYYAGGYLGFCYSPHRGAPQVKFYSHRMIYFLYHGVLPDAIDHIDRDKTNNRVLNLRAATKSGNAANCRSVKNSSSIYLGVHWSAGKWVAMISVDHKNKYLGRFTYEKEAARAYNKAAAEHHGEFANLNVIEGGEE